MSVIGDLGGVGKSIFLATPAPSLVISAQPPTACPRPPRRPLRVWQIEHRAQALEAARQPAEKQKGAMDPSIGVQQQLEESLG